jgi:hypothetical protein
MATTSLCRTLSCCPCKHLISGIVAVDVVAGWQCHSLNGFKWRIGGSTWRKIHCVGRDGGGTGVGKVSPQGAHLARGALEHIGLYHLSVSHRV